MKHTYYLVLAESRPGSLEQFFKKGGGEDDQSDGGMGGRYVPGSWPKNVAERIRLFGAGSWLKDVAER